MAKAVYLDYNPLSEKPRRNKYGVRLDAAGRANRTSKDGILHASAAQCRRWEELLLLEKAGEILCLAREVRLPIKVNDVSVGVYVADHTYIDRATGRTVYEDVKSPATRKNSYYRLKKRLFEAAYGRNIQEVEGR
jgi:hypothetical protein